MKYKSKNKIDYRMVINSREIAVIGLVCTLFSGVATVAAAISGAGMATCILFGVFAVLGVILVLTVNQRVDYTDKDFTYRDMLRITHRYEYSQVKKIRYGGNLIITVGKRLILIDENASNIDGFAKELIQHSENAEVINSEKSKLFRGNIRHPGGFILVDIIVMAAPVFLLVVALFANPDIMPDEITIYTGRITEYHFDKSDNSGRFIITVSDRAGEKRTFATGFIEDNSQEYKDIEINIAKNREFEIGYIDKENDEETDIRLFSCGNTCYVSLDDVNSVNDENRKTLFVLSGVFFAFAILYVVASTYIMSNADRYPRLIKLFEQEDHIISKDGNKKNRL